MMNRHDRYSSDCFIGAVEKRGCTLPTSIDNLIGDLVRSIVRHRELRSQWFPPAQRFDAKRTVSRYTDTILAQLSDKNSITVVRDEIFKMDDLYSNYIEKMYPECLL